MHVAGTQSNCILEIQYLLLVSSMTVYRTYPAVSRKPSGFFALSRTKPGTKSVSVSS